MSSLALVTNRTLISHHAAPFAAAGVPADVVRLELERFFVPPYVGHRGGLGVHLNVDPDWQEIAGVIEDAYRLVAPKTLIKKLDER